jgi:diguanylate cyclase (GGDEF)-like protein/PAS domain S-box-containing protein
MTHTQSEIEELQDRLKRLEAFMDNSPMAVFMKDERGRYVYFNDRMQNMYYAPLTDLAGKTDLDWLPAYLANEIRAIDEQVLWTGATMDTVQAVPAPDGSETHWAIYRFLFVNTAGEKFVGGIAADITELKQMQQQLEELSLTDDLTGLHNRRGFVVLAEDRITLARRNDENMLLIFADLDGLKKINDTLGHAVGSEAIQAAATVLRSSFRDSDVISRWGGDEFVALLGKAPNEKAERVAQRFEEKLKAFNDASERPFKLSVSLGIKSIDPGSNETLEQLIEQADGIMYENKRRRKEQSTESEPSPVNTLL